MMEAALDNMVTGGYITVCGMISCYNSPGDPLNNLVTVSDTKAMVVLAWFCHTACREVFGQPFATSSPCVTCPQA